MSTQSGGPLNSNLPINPYEPSGDSSTTGLGGTPQGRGYPLLDILLQRIPLLYPKPNQLKVSHSKVDHETKNENEDESRDRSEARIDEEVQEKTEKVAEEETEEVIPIPCKKQGKKRLSPPVTLESVYFELPVLIVN
ncbi:hypothetical protein ACH5RR_030002 [Cinchona calisaya]|uniref:Uncharacterized protein n=1 Tax=Cinchona calisaya TaxID=153742 RepID=A0ABD2YUR7_9GENT